MTTQTQPTNGEAGATAPAVPLSRKDFVTDQEVRWCPACGNYSILAQMQKILPDLGVPREKLVFISGIGCSSRFPYYMNTYGFHSIHGRAPAVASGVKLANPDLTVFVITGDGDGLSIGGNHLIHTLRRNINLNIILFNNRIYGLTKGQYSPTSEFGKKTKSSPFGTIETPLNPLCVALAAEATFVARSLDVDTAHLAATLKRAAEHNGTSFIEVYQNCNIFNDGAFLSFSEKKVRAEQCLYLEHGKPITFGKDGNKGIRLRGINPEIVTIGENGVTESDLLVHDEKAPEPTLAYFLTRMNHPEYPVPLGVFRAVEKPTYEHLLDAQIRDAQRTRGVGQLDALLRTGDSWTVTE